MAPPTHLSVVDTAKFTFVLNDFSSLNRSTWSDEFASSKYPKYSFILGLFPQSTFEHFEKDVFFCLWICDKTDRDELAVQYRVSVLDANGEKNFTKEILWNHSKDDHNIIVLAARSYLLDPANGLLPDGKLTVYCEVDILNNMIPHIPEASFLPDKTQQDFESLLENGKLSDVVLVVGKKEFQTHKNILVARSQVFGVMFENKETKESIESRVEIIDVDVEVFEEMLSYIYTGKIPKTDKNALALFVAADKYQLDHLKSVCEQTLSTTLTVESVVSTFMVADMHQAGDLKSKCIEYITKHSVKVMATDGWAQFVKANRFELLHQLFAAIASKKTKKTTGNVQRKRKRLQKQIDWIDIE